MCNIHRKHIHRTPERHIHRQLDDSPPTPRKQHYQHQSTTGKPQAAYGNTRKHITKTGMENHRFDDRRIISQ